MRLVKNLTDVYQSNNLVYRIAHHDSIALSPNVQTLCMKTSDIKTEAINLQAETHHCYFHGRLQAPIPLSGLFLSNARRESDNDYNPGPIAHGILQNSDSKVLSAEFDKSFCKTFEQYDKYYIEDPPLVVCQNASLKQDSWFALGYGYDIEWGYWQAACETMDLWKIPSRTVHFQIGYLYLDDESMEKVTC